MFGLAQGIESPYFKFTLGEGQASVPSESEFVATVPCISDMRGSSYLEELSASCPEHGPSALVCSVLVILPVSVNTLSESAVALSM